MMKLVRAIRARLHHAHPDHHAIARGMAWVALFVLLGSVARAAKEIVIAYRYGVSAEVDAYLFVFSLVSWPVGVWFSVLTVVLVPLAARLQQGAPKELPRFRAELLGLTLLLGLVLTLFGWFGLPWLLNTSWIGLSSMTLAIALEMVPGLALLAFLGVVISLLSAWMLASNRHANTLLESVPATVVVVALVAFPMGGAAPLVWGTLAGFACHLASLLLLLIRQGNVEAPRFTHKSSEWSPFWQGFGVMLAGQTLMSLTGIIDQLFASHLGTGAIATLSYANRILALILGMGAMAVSRATLPIFSRARAQGGLQARRIALHWMRLLFVMGVCASLLSSWLAPWMVRLLFERGAFTATDSEAVVNILHYGLAQIPFYFSGLVLVSLLVSHGKYRVIAGIASINLLVKIVASLILVRWFGIGGLILATAFMYLVSMVLCWLAVRRAM